MEEVVIEEGPHSRNMQQHFGTRSSSLWEDSRMAEEETLSVGHVAMEEGDN